MIIFLFVIAWDISVFHTSEGQLPMGARNALLEQMGQAQAEKKEMKEIVKNTFHLTKETLNDKTLAQNRTLNKDMYLTLRQLMIKVQQ